MGEKGRQKQRQIETQIPAQCEDWRSKGSRVESGTKTGKVRGVPHIQNVSPKIKLTELHRGATELPSRNPPKVPWREVHPAVTQRMGRSKAQGWG